LKLFYFLFFSYFVTPLEPPNLLSLINLGLLFILLCYKHWTFPFFLNIFLTFFLPILLNPLFKFFAQAIIYYGQINTMAVFSNYLLIEWNLIPFLSHFSSNPVFFLPHIYSNNHRHLLLSLRKILSKFLHIKSVRSKTDQ
jgi:hypothetical protein